MEDNLEQLRYPIGRYKTPDGHTPELMKQWTDVLTALPSWMDVCIENLDEAQLHTPYRPGGWTVQQVVHHLADSHMNSYIRLKLALTEDNPTIKPYLEQEWAKMEDTQALPVNLSVTLLHALHRRWVAIIKSMKPADLERTYFHPEQGRTIPVWELVAMYAWHSRHHMEHVRQLRQRMGWS